MILIRNLRLGPGEDESRLAELAAEKAGTDQGNISGIKILKKSLDARKKGNIHYVYSVAAGIKNGERSILKKGRRDIAVYQRKEYLISDYPAESPRPVIAGFGPAGMFAALVLARAGARPVILERGFAAPERQKAVEAFRKGGKLDEKANVQFGEGGAGTFSDGKLNTGINDERLSWVLEQFYAHGAPESVTYDAKPHIGTDILVDVVQNFRKEIVSLGGEVRFSHRLDGLISSEGRLCGVKVSCEDGDYEIHCKDLILAIGHSARDTFEMLSRTGVSMEQKPFSMGVRIEHLQGDINTAQYGETDQSLPPADYSLNVHLPNGTSAYTFCMCPGGEVIAAASETGGVVTNGMSVSARNGENANAALLVTLHTEDFPGKGPLAGMYWQREIEQAAFRYGGSNYHAPAQLLGDFLGRKASTGAGAVSPSYRPGVKWGDIREVLPERITQVLENAIPELGKKLKGFDSYDAVLTAPETRSSSPVRIIRGKDLSSDLQGLYPCGEGAGYAGGISSAAVDGMRCAEALIKKYREE